MSENKLIEKRFIAVLVAILATAGLTYANRLGAANFEQIIIWVVGLFVAGSASDTWAQYYSTAKVRLTGEKQQLNG